MGIQTLTMAFLMLVSGNPLLGVAPINQRSFDIPIRITARKEEIRELNLVVSVDQGRTWGKTTVASPEQTHFTYQASTDGVYWFKIIVIDKDGNPDPPDPMEGQPGLKVLVDTLPPSLRITSAERGQGDEVVVRWEIVDQHIDLASLKLLYRADNNQNWSPVNLTPAVTGQASFRPVIPGPITIRMEVEDLAKNPASTQAEVAAAQGNAPAAYVSGAPNHSPPAWTPIQPPSGVILRDPPPQRIENQGTMTGGWNTPQTGNTTGNPIGQLVAETRTSPGAASSGAPLPAANQQRVVRSPTVPTRIVNSNRVTLDYEVAKFGPSGLRSVTLYVTRDEGRNWQQIGEQPIDPPQAQELQGQERTLRRSLSVDLQEDGIYGFYLVVRNGAGLGKPPPQVGETPQMRVEVDRTSPEAKLYAPEPDKARRDVLILRWVAVDRNLTATPITLQWARQPAGPWETIGAPELPNTGQFVWELRGATMPPQVYLRLTVRDGAGNEGVAETPEPILIDLTEPEVKILNVDKTHPR